MKLTYLARASAASVALFGAAALASTAFAAEVPSGTKLASDQSFTYRVLDAINALDPDTVEDVDTAAVVEQIFEGLYNEDASGNIVPGVATGYDVSADKKTYTIHLRPEAKWSNGDPLTAADFVFGWRRAADPKTASPYAYFLPLASVANAQDIIDGKKPITDLGVKAVDDHTLQVTLASAIPYFPKMLAHPTLFPVPEKVVEKFGQDWTKPENIVGNGAYTLAQNTPGERVVLKRNKQYWDDAKTAIETVNVLSINDENQALTRYQAGELDWTDVPTGQLPTLTQQSPKEAHSVPFLCNYYYDINVTKSGMPALQDVRVREALAYAIDRDVVVNSVLQGGQTPAFGFVPPSTAGYKAPTFDYAGLTQDQRDAKAKELLLAAGYGPDHPLSFTLLYNTSEAHKQVATVVTEMWKEKLGIDVTLQNEEWKTFLADRHKFNYQVARDAWCGDYNDASTFVSLMTTSSTENNAGYSNADYDKLMTQSTTSDDPNTPYQQAEQQLIKDMPVLPVYFYAKPFMLKTDLIGWPYKNIEQIWYAKDFYKTAD